LSTESYIPRVLKGERIDGFELLEKEIIGSILSFEENF
jgi:hypothetical protein